MKIRSQQDHATYAAVRFCRAIDRVLKAETNAEKMNANLWAAAWSTLYFSKTDRRRASNSNTYSQQLNRRRRTRSSAKR